MNTPTIHPPAGGEHLSVVGDRVRILADGAATGGKFLVFEETGPPGGGPPLHRHTHDDEFFLVLEGTLRFSVDGKETIVEPGGTIFARKGSVHTFVNAGQTPTRLIIVCSPPGLEGPFRECDQLAREGRENPETVAAAFKKFGVEIVGPPLTP